jgi:hypothetical protein
MRTSRTIEALVCVGGLMAAGCGGSEQPETAKAEPTKTTGEEKPEPKSKKNEPQVEGLMGTLPQFAIQSKLRPRMREFARCFAERSEDVEMLGGRIKLAFRVATDGSVKWVYPKSSTIGDRKTEKCILEVASEVQFRDPTGGEAEFSWPFERTPPSDVRPATEWEPSKLEDVLEENASDVVSECRPKGKQETFDLTAYVGPGGETMAVGASAKNHESGEAIDCVVEKIKEWEMPDPGSYPAKVTFELKEIEEE